MTSKRQRIYHILGGAAALAAVGVGVQQARKRAGLSIARHLFIHYPDDPRVYSLCYEQFLVGTELLVAPVLDPGRDTVAVYLPAGRWLHLWTGTVHGAATTGITTIIPAPLGQPAIFYRAGSDVGAQFAENLRVEGVLHET